MSAALSSSFGEVLWDTLGRTYGRLRGGAKLLAADGDASLAAAENWLRRRNLPQGESLIALMAASPAVNDLVEAAVLRRRAETARTRAEWRASYDAALGALSAAESVGAGGLDRRSVVRAGGCAGAGGLAVLTVDRRRAGR